MKVCIHFNNWIVDDIKRSKIVLMIVFETRLFVIIEFLKGSFT